MRAVKVPCLEGGRIGPSTESFINCDGPISMVPCLHQGNIYIKRNATSMERLEMYSVNRCHNPILTVKAVKIHRIERGSVGPRNESCVFCDGPISMIPCIDQGNIYTKRKIRVWTDQKCIPLVGAITPLNCEGRQNAPSVREAV